MPENSYDIINLETLNKVLSTKNNQNSKNFKMVLDRQPINYSNCFSLTKIDKLTNNFNNIVKEFQDNLYFSVQSRKAF